LAPWSRARTSVAYELPGGRAHSPNIELALKEDRLLWLDLQGTGDEVLTVLREVFKIHPLAVEDVERTVRPGPV
jgi:Mg2+ and Co2+ transporter CorA